MLKNTDPILSDLFRKIILFLSIALLAWGFVWRFNLALDSSPGGDFSTHVRAIYDLVDGRNPYAWTVESYENLENDPTNKGYAYFPGILYVNTFLYLMSVICRFTLGLDFAWCSPSFMLHLPGILASAGISAFLLWHFYKKKDYLAMVFSVGFWSLNFYLVLKNSLAGFDAVPILMMLLALNYLEEDDVLSGLFFALSILFKTFAVILFPLFLLRSRKPLKFLVAGFITAFVFSIPFMTSVADFWTYVQGALLVHGERFVQGRPFLYYISYYYDVELFRIISFSFYSLGSIFSGWVLISINRLLKIFSFSKVFKRPVLKGWHLENKYSVAVLPFLSFYALTPVLNRTYLLWGLPVFLLGSYEFFKRKRLLVLFYVLNCVWWVFCYWYLAQWKDGFHIWHPI